jgi:hypothetical protein
MGKRNKQAVAEKPKGPIQAMLDRQANEEAARPIVNNFAEQHGDFEKNLRFIRNRGGTALDRWKRDGNISESQEAGILHCQALWSRLKHPRVVANLNANGGGYNEGWTLHQVEALDALHQISSAFPHDYWNVFENVCRHDLPAGVAGSRLANTKRSAEAAARMIVCFIADLIAMRERLSY